MSPVPCPSQGGSAGLHILQGSLALLWRDLGLHPQHPPPPTEAVLPKFPGLLQPDTKEVSTCLLNE